MYNFAKIRPRVFRGKIYLDHEIGQAKIMLSVLVMADRGRIGDTFEIRASICDIERETHDAYAYRYVGSVKRAMAGKVVAVSNLVTPLGVSAGTHINRQLAISIGHSVEVQLDNDYDVIKLTVNKKELILD